MMSVVYIYQFFRYFLRGQTNLKLREFEWIFLIRNSWLRSSFSKWNTRLRLWYLPPVTLFNFKFSSVIKLCICFYIWLKRIVWVRCALVHDQLDGFSNVWIFERLNRQWYSNRHPGTLTKSMLEKKSSMHMRDFPTNTFFIVITAYT